MPITLPPMTDEEPIGQTPGRVKWTRKQCEFLVENELLKGRYELIDGEVISKMGQNPPHAAVVAVVNRFLLRLFGVDFVRVQSTSEVDFEDQPINEPEPDVIVTNRVIDEFFTKHPGPDDIRLVVEVSDSSVRFDLSVKAKLYARSSYPEYWVVDIPGRRIVVHLNPIDGQYSTVIEYSEQDVILPQGFEQGGIVVAELLPPVSTLV
jgi:Uma2 family endonuclease